jgi:hypothetical protein
MHQTDNTPDRGADKMSAPLSAKAAIGSNSLIRRQTLLAVDSGLKTGLALYTTCGELIWYRSHNFGNRTRLKKAAWRLLNEIEGLSRVVVEGGGRFAEVWVKAAGRCGLPVLQVQAETWRKSLLLASQQHSGKQAKQVANELAREIIEKSTAATGPTSLRHDTAEAILVGWWAVSRK